MVSAGWRRYVSLTIGNGASAYTTAQNLACKPCNDGKPRQGATPAWRSYVRLMSTGPISVVGLGAWCDLHSREEDAGCGTGTSFVVREFALLSDGREIALLDDRGWTTSAPLGGTVSGEEARMPVRQVVRNIYNVVLPDDAEETGQEHEWQRFAQRLGEAGIAVTSDELRALPYRVILSARLRSQLGQPS